MVTIRFRLLTLCGAMLLTMAVMGGVGYGYVRSETNRSTEFITEDFTAVVALGAARGSLANVHRYEKDTFLNMAEEADFKRYQVQWRNEITTLRKSLDHIETLNILGHAEAINTIRKGLTGYSAGYESIVKDIETGKINDPWGASKSVEKFKAEVRAADKALDELSKKIGAHADLQRNEVQQSAKTAAMWIGMISLLCLSCAMVLGLLTIRAIIRPLDELRQTAEVIAGGDLSHPISINRDDELGALARSMQEMQSWLNEVVSEVRSTSQYVATASSEIAQGNSDLSSRTENQAASLQQTAATIEQLTATVRQSATTAQRASTLAFGATEAAETGGKRVAGVIETMSEIQTSSKKISEIIAVIDAIAFQTNILALNAAVEAARAGEQGRGFNVVAGEVRMLAKRCAEAAQEVKKLITESVSKVESGSARVLAAGETMGEIVSSVKRVTELVKEISQTTEEQSGGIEQASQAIAQLDQMTQQNAALVEQSAAAATSLDHQAQSLNRLVGVFKLRTSAAF